MKYTFLTAFAALSLTASAQLVPQARYNGPTLTLETDVYDYGTIEQGGNPFGFFNVVNTGTEPLILSNCKGSCGCTVPVCDPAPIMPGDTTVIQIKYDTNRIGPINKSVTIVSNSVTEPVKVIRIKGVVEPLKN